MMATLAGIGVARFAYTPLLPAIIQAEWFSPSQAAYLGAANLLGYLIGALAGHPLSERFSTRGLFGLCFAGIALSFLLCAGPNSFGWFFIWRLVAGIAGAILVVVGPSLALTATPPARRTGVGTLVFTGIGLGTLVSALVVPALLAVSLTATWIALGVLIIIAGIFCDHNLVQLTLSPPHAAPDSPPSDAHQEHPQKAQGHPEQAHKKPAGLALVIALVMMAYALDAIGFVPHTVFWVDYLAREKSAGRPRRLVAVGHLWRWRSIGAVYRQLDDKAAGLAQGPGTRLSDQGGGRGAAAAVHRVYQPVSVVLFGRRDDSRHRRPYLRAAGRARRPYAAQTPVGTGHRHLCRRAGVFRLRHVRPV